MLPISTKDVVRFTPAALEKRGDAPVFLLRVPTVRERIALDAAVAREGSVFPSNADLAQALRDAIAENVVEDEVPALIAIVEDFAAASEDGGKISDDLAAKIGDMVRTLRRHYRPLAQIGADREEHLSTAFLVRAEFMIVGVEGDNAPAVERRNGRLTERCVEAIESRYGIGTMIAVGGRCWELTNPTEDDTKNSDSPQPSPPGPATSRAAKAPRMAQNGKSSENAISETLGSA